MTITIDTTKWITQREYATKTRRSLQSVGNDIRKGSIRTREIPELYLVLIDAGEVAKFLRRKQERTVV